MLTSKKEKIDYFEAIQLISLSNLYNLKNDKPTDRDYDLNRIFRYYSKTFVTPLHEVIRLPLHHVLTAYFDDLFESMDPEQIEDVRVDLLKSAEERAQAKDAADTNEVDLYEIMKETAKEAEKAAAKIEALGKSGARPLISNKGDVPLENPLLAQKKPDIKMSFINSEQMDSLIEKDSLGLLDP